MSRASQVIEAKAAELNAAADAIWETPELAFTEYQSAKILIDFLRKEGFTVEEELAGIRTAFSGRFGHGRPVLGVLGEFDALSGLGQEAGALEKKPNGKTAGQGCGHNLLGVGSLAAALAVKRYLEETGAEGTIVYYGCPGEEGGSGKAFMARDHVFDELDAAVSWHPAIINKVRTSSSLANYQILFKFDGTAAHAAANPDMGRSALDALELMNIGVQFLREHMPSSARIHYSIIDAGGISPNVVQPHAEALYLIRATTNDGVRALYERVLKIAEGAALMTETKESHEFVKACSNLVMNDTLQREMDRIMQQIAPPVPDENDMEYARELTKRTLMGAKHANPDDPYAYKKLPYDFKEGETAGAGSTDVGDVSWICPLAQLSAATWCLGTPGHSWQVVAQGKLAAAKAAMRYAGVIMGETLISLLENPALLEKAKEEFRDRVGKGYVAPIPVGVKPRALSDL